MWITEPRLESFLEVITQYLSSKTLREKDTLEVVQKSAQDKLLFGNGMDAHQTPLSSARTGLSRPLTSRNPVRDPILQAEVNPGLHVDTGYRPPILGAFVESNPKSVPPLLPVKASGSVSQTQPAFTIPGSGQRPASGGLVIHDLDIDELNLDSDEDLSDMKQSATWAQSKGSPLSTHTIQEVLEVIFPAKTKPRFGEEWTGKGFVFRNSDTLRYGLVQTKGGPCGLLAAVQAHVLKFLLFSPSTFTKDNDKKTR